MALTFPSSAGRLPMKLGDSHANLCLLCGRLLVDRGIRPRIPDATNVSALVDLVEHCQQILLGECAKPGSSFKIQHAQTCPTNRHRQKGLRLLLLLLSHRIHGIVVLGVAFSVTAKNNICSKTPFP